MISRIISDATIRYVMKILAQEIKRAELQLLKISLLAVLKKPERAK